MRLHDLTITHLALLFVPLIYKSLDNLLQRQTNSTLLRMVVLDQQGFVDQAAGIKIELLRVLVGNVHEDGDERALEHLESFVNVRVIE